MLERVVINQISYETPGIIPDMHGVVFGRYGAVVLPSFERLIAFLGTLSQKCSLDEMLPSSRIYQTLSEVSLQEYVLIFGAKNIYQLDKCADVIRFLDGNLYTGTEKHFVAYRDHASPLGYDISGPVHIGHADLVFYTASKYSSFNKIKEIRLSRLIVELSLKKSSHQESVGPPDVDAVWLRIRTGLLRSVLGYLRRHHIEAQVGKIGSKSEILEEHEVRQEESYLFQVKKLPRRASRQFASIPGITVYNQINPNVLVESGYQHPIQLDSCSHVFEREKFYIFSEKKNESFEELHPLFPIETLMKIELKLNSIEKMDPLHIKQLNVQMSLSPMDHSLCSVQATAAMISWQKAGLLRKMIYVLPSTIMRHYQVALIEEGIFIVSQNGIYELPLGELYRKYSASIFIPLDRTILPQISPEILDEQIEGLSEKYIILFPLSPPGNVQAISIPRNLFQPLERRALATIPLQAGHRSEKLNSPFTSEETVLVNDATGIFPLWDYRNQ